LTVGTAPEDGPGTCDLADDSDEAPSGGKPSAR
jgi:hypothetical protein